MGQTTRKKGSSGPARRPTAGRTRAHAKPRTSAVRRARRQPATAGGRTVAGFYNKLAGTYDAMTNFEHRFLREGQMLRMMVVRNAVKTALDAGCGTGFHALFLARLGVRVTAVDLSSEMIRHVDAHARQMGVKVNAVRAPFNSLAKRLHRKFDAVFCMGNTLAHLPTASLLQKTLNEFAALLHSGGFLVLQILNFDRIVTLGSLPRIERETSEGTFVRSFELRGEAVRLTIEHHPLAGGVMSRQSLDLRPVYHTELLTLLTQAGFPEVELFGSIEMEPFDPAASNDIVIIART